MNNENNNIVKEIYDKINEIIRELFSNNGNIPWKQINDIEKRKDKISILRIHEMLMHYSFEIKKMKDAEWNIRDMSWVANATKEIVDKLSEFLSTKRYDLRNKIIEKINLESFEKIDPNVVHIISDKHRKINSSKKDKKKSLPKIDGVHEFVNFMFAIRNLLIHFNSTGYEFILFDLSSEEKGVLHFKEVHGEFHFYIHDADILNFLNEILKIVIDEKESIKNYYADFLERVNSTKETFKKDIQKYDLKGPSKMSIGGQKAMTYYIQNTVIEAANALSEYTELAINIMVISELHYLDNVCDDEFVSMILNFSDFQYVVLNDRKRKFHYELSQRWDFEDITKEALDVEVLAQIEGINKDAKFYENFAAFLLRKKEKEIPNLQEIVKKYSHSCYRREYSFKKFKNENKHLFK